MKARTLRAGLLVAALAGGTGAAVMVGGMTAAWAGWQQVANRYDQHRLAQLQQSRAEAMQQAERGAPPHDLAILHAVLDPAPKPVSVRALLGNWRCRTLKLGGITPDVIYDWFRCRISMKGGGPYLEKLTGSQFTNGYLYPFAGGSFIYLGASSVIGEPRHSYPGNGASAGAKATPDDQIGLLTAISPRHLRLEMPYPVQESTMDVLELKR